MHLMSCEHPKRVYNKYMDKYLWVPCGKCNSCKNRRAAMLTDACERERAASAFTMFITLTYDEVHLPVYTYTGGFDYEYKQGCLMAKDTLIASREKDTLPLKIDDSLFDEQADKDLFDWFLANRGIPYTSKSDLQLFNKRLNKWFYNNVTHKFENFRYFLISELGSTTLRPHAHGIYFINDAKVAERFNEAILSCWKYGRTDCQYVENSACSYVAQYVNKLADLPSFYKARAIRPFYLCSRNPFIGAGNKYAESDEEIFNKSVVQTFSFGKKDFQPIVVQVDKSTENRLFPKCPLFGEISHSLRVELYSICRRIRGETFSEFKEDCRKWLGCLEKRCCIFAPARDYFSMILEKYVDGFSESGENWLRRIYYLSRRAMKMAQRFGISISDYVRKIEDYYNKKELFILSCFYKFQEDYVKEEGNCSDDLVLMYPEYLYVNGITIADVFSSFTPKDVLIQRQDAASLAYSNKKTHYKNMYLESLELKNNKFFNQLKRFYYAKKCNEISEAFAPSGTK